jgi:hypothetical protein
MESHGDLRERAGKQEDIPHEVLRFAENHFLSGVSMHCCIIIEFVH